MIGLSQLAIMCKDIVLAEGGLVFEGGGFSFLPKDLAIAVVADE